MKVKAITSYEPNNLGYIDPYTKAQGWGTQPNQGLYYEGKILVNGAEPYNRKCTIRGTSWNPGTGLTYSNYSPGNSIGGLWPLESDNATWDNLTKNMYQLENARKVWKTKTIPDTDTNDVIVIMMQVAYMGKFSDSSPGTQMQLYFDGSDTPLTLEEAVNQNIIEPVVIIDAGRNTNITESTFWTAERKPNTFNGNYGPEPCFVWWIYTKGQYALNSQGVATNGRYCYFNVTFKLKPGHHLSKFRHMQFEHNRVGPFAAIYTLNSTDYNITLKDYPVKLNNGQFDYNINIKEANNG